MRHFFLYFSNNVTMDTNSYFPIAFNSSFAFSVFWLLNYAPKIDHEHWLICDMSSTSQCLKITKKVSFYNYIYVQIENNCKIVKKINFWRENSNETFLVIFIHCFLMIQEKSTLCKNSIFGRKSQFITDFSYLFTF